MGQGNSAEAPVSLEHLSHALAERFAEKCYTPLELYCYKQVFRSLSDNESGVKYWDETTLCRFLELPDALGVGPVVFQMASYLGAFPFPSQAPAILTLDALLKVVTILTERYGAVVKRRGREQWIAEIYRSLAVIDRVALKQPDEKRDHSDIAKDTATEKSAAVEEAAEKAKKNMIFSLDEGIEDVDDDEDMLMIAALDYMDAGDVLKKSEKINWHHSIIPSDNLLKLIELLLLIAPLDPMDSVSKTVGQLSDERLQRLRKTACNVLVAFGIDNTPGISYSKFKIIVSTSLPYLFDGLNPLFEHFLFAKNFDLHKKKGSIDATPSAPAPTHSKEPPPPEPILASEGDILNLNVLSQLSFFIKGSNLFRRLRLLYSGNEHGFSMGSFEKAVFNWKAPSILLVSGTLLPPTPSTPSERTFADSLPPKRLPSSMSDSLQIRTVTFGAYIPVPWKQTPKTPFGDSSTVLFQLGPTHDVFAASKAVTDYAYFCRPPSKPSGLGFGSSLPQASTSYHSSSKPVMLGPTSLHLDDALEFGVFTHVSAGGGSFYPSRNPERRDKDWQDRFSVEALEVWGCGGDEEAEAQRKAWKWEENEAEMRRRVNVGRGDVEADRQLLEMAGLIGGNRSGGSV